MDATEAAPVRTDPPTDHIVTADPPAHSSKPTEGGAGKMPGKKPGRASGNSTRGTNRTRGTRARGDRTPPRSLIQRTATKALQLAASHSVDRSLIAALVHTGDPDDIVDLTTAVITSPASDAGPVDDVLAIATADPMEAGVIAAGMEAAELKAVIALVNFLVEGDMPVKTSKSPTADALACARRIATLATENPVQIDRLRGVRETIWGKTQGRRD